MEFSTLRPYNHVWCAQVCEWTHNQGAHRLAPPQLKPLIYFAKTHLCHVPPASSYPQVALCPPDQNQSVMGSRTIVLASSRNLNRFPLWPVVWHDRKYRVTVCIPLQNRGPQARRLVQYPASWFLGGGWKPYMLLLLQVPGELLAQLVRLMPDNHIINIYWAQRFPTWNQTTRDWLKDSQV